MADKITNDITLLFKTKLDEKSKQEIGKNLKSLLENAAIGFDEAETKRNLEPIIRMMKRLFDKAEIAFDADQLLAMPGRQALQKMAEMEVDQLQMAFDKALAKSGGIKVDFGDMDLSAMTEPLEKLTQELSEIGERVASTTKKSVREIENSINGLSRLKPKKTTIKVLDEKGVEQEVIKEVSQVEQTIGNIEKTLGAVNNPKHYTSAKKATAQLESARAKYAKSVVDDDPWEIQYQHLLTFVARYEAMTKKIKPLVDTSNPEFKQLYEMLSPKAGAAKISLEHFVDIAQGNELREYKNQPWARENTLKKIEQTLRSGITVKDGPNDGQNGNAGNDDSTPPWDVDDGGGKENKSPRTKVPIAEMPDVDEEEKARIEAEKKAQAEKAAAEAAKKRRIEEEKIAKAVKKEIKVYRGIIPPEDEASSRREVLDSVDGAEWWTNKKDVAQTYADQDVGGTILVGTITPKNPLVIDAGKHNFDEFAKMPGIIANLDKFPELMSKISAGEGINDTQKYINDVARELGHDVVEFINVNDVMNPKEYVEIGTSYAVLNDSILQLVGALSQKSYDLKEEIGEYEKKPNMAAVPEYYFPPEDEQSAAAVDVTNDGLVKEATLLEKIQKLTTYIDNEYLSTGKHLSDFLDDVQRESNELNSELKEILTTLNLIDDKGNLTFDVKRNGEEGGGTTHNGALISDDFVLIERGDYEKVKDSRLPDNTQRAAKDGVNVAEVLGYLPSKHTNGFFDVQGTARGQNLFDNGVLSQDVVNATEDQLEQLVQAFIKARDYGFNIENGGNNIVYDKEKGFSFYDLEELSVDDTEFWNSKTEAEKKLYALEDLFSLFSGLNREHTNFADDANVGDFAERIKGIIETKGIVNPDAVDVMGRNYEDIYDDVFSGNIDEEYDDIVALLQAEANAHKENEATIVAETQAQEALNDAKAEAQQIDVKEDAATTVGKPVTTVGSVDGVGTKGSIQTEELRQLLNSITYNVKVVQDAEPTEDNKISIDEAALENVLNRITYNVKIAHDDADKTANKIAIDEGALEQTLNRVFSSVLNPEVEQTESEPKNEPWALEKTLLSVKEVLDGIRTNTAKVESVEIAPASTEVGNVLATENTLAAIKNVVETINSKIANGTRIETGSTNGGANKRTGTSNPYDISERIKTQRVQLAKLTTQLVTSGRLTDNIGIQISKLLSELDEVENGPDLSKWAQRFTQLKATINIDDMLNKVVDDSEKDAYKELLNYQKTRNQLELQYTKAADGSQLKAFYKEQLDVIDDLISTQLILNENEEYAKKLAEDRAKQEIKLGAERAKQTDREAKIAKKEMQKQAMLGKAGNAVGRAQGVYIEAEGLDPKKLPKSFTQKGGVLDSYYSAFEKLRQKQTDLSKLDIISDEQKKDLRDQINNVNQMTSEIGELVSQYQRLSGDNVKELGVNTLRPNAGLKEYEAELKRLASASANGKIQIKSFDNETKTLTYTVKNAKREVTTYTATLRGLDNQFVTVAGSTKRAESFLEATKRKMSEISSYMSGMAVFSRIGQELRRGIQYIREIDLALTELKKVTDETEETYDKFLDTAAKTGARLGTTISAVTDATATFAKLGYSMKQATEMAEAAIVYKNVGDNIESTGDAADSIISTMKGFRLEASESMAIVDRFNEVGNRFAITSQGIGEALRLSASALSEGGNSLDESIGLITAANEVVNDPSSVGTALKTLTLRLRGSKTELEEMGEDVSDMATTTSQLQAKLLALTGGQADIMLDANTFKNSTQILREMADAWEDMTDIQRASALELMGGKRQANVLSALIQNFDTVESVIETSANSAGSALKENERYLDSIQGKIDQFNNAMQAMWSNTLDSDMVKGFVSLGTEIIKVIDKIGLLNTALIALATYSMIKNKMGPIAFLGGISDIIRSVVGKVGGFISSLTGMTAATSAYTAETLAASVANGTLSASEAASIATKNGLTLATTNLTAAEAAEMLMKAGVAKADALAMVAKLGLTASTQALSLADLQAAVDLGILTVAEMGQIASALGLTKANTTLAASFGALWTAIWPILAVMAGVAVIWGAVKLIDHLVVTTEELTEELNNLKTELQDVQSEIETVNSELETMEDRMAELLAKDSLSFVEQEELDRLQKENNELQRRLDLLEAEEKIKQNKAAETFVQTMESYGDKTYKRGGEMNWWEWLWSGDSAYAESQDEYIDKLMGEYDKVLKVDSGELDRSVLVDEMDADWYSEKIGAEVQALVDAANGLDYFEGDNLTDKQKEVNEWLDYVYNTQDKLAIMRGGENAKTNAINRIFDKDENAAISDSIDEYVEALRKGDTSAKTSIENIIKNNKTLVEDLEASELSVGAAVDYFTSFASELEFATLEGKIKEVSSAAKSFESLLKGGLFKVDDVDTGLADLFDEEGKIIQTKLSQVFQGTSEQTRAEITRLLEGSYDMISDGLDDAEINYLMNRMGLSFSRAILEIEKNNLATKNLELFPGLEDEISGIIDTFSELTSAVGSVVDAMDTLDKARAEEAYSGSMSLETLEALMQSTDNYADLIEVDETGAIKLATNAQEILVAQKLEAIKQNAALALKEAELAYEEALHTEQTYSQTGPAQEFMRGLWNEVGGAMAFVSSLWSDLTSGNWDGAWDRAKQARESSITTKETEYSTKAAEASAAVAEAAKNVENAEKMNKIAQGLTPENIKKRYSSEEASGGADDPEEVKENALDELMEEFQREMDYWENRIGANQARYEQLQNEIDLLESKGQKADASFYDEQIKLENERKWLLEQQRKAASSYLAMLEEGSEEWWEVANTLNDIEGELDDVTASIVDLQDAIGEIDTYKFEEFNNRLDNLTSKLETIRDLIAPNSEEDWFDEEGQWTEAGVAYLASYIQDLADFNEGLMRAKEEYAKYTKEYTGNEDYYANLGIHSEQELYDKQEELIEQQYDYAQSISNTEQSVVDMYESNIDAIEEYTETLIDSYNDYIDSVKEALDAERDLYDFKKNVQKQSKDIAAIERRIASLSGSTNASDIAERRKLEAQLYESRESLNDTYYDHARSAQDEALDAEATAYEETMTKFIEGLRVSLDQATTNMDEFLMGVTSMVMYNADTVLTKYQETNLPLTDELTNPWIKAKEAVGTYSGDALTLMNRWTEEGGFFAQFNATGTKNLQSPWSAGSTAADAFKTNISTTMEQVVTNIESNIKKAKASLTSLTDVITTTAVYADGTIGESYSGNSGSENSGGTGESLTSTPTPTAPKKTSTPARQSTPTRPKFKKVGDVWSGVGHTGVSIGKKTYNKALEIEGGDGIYYPYTNGNGYKGYIKKGEGYTVLSKSKMDVQSLKPLYQKYAKGTTNTTRDEWAITDEPQFGDELVLVPGKDGNLSFMRKGTGVVPADMTQKLFELAQIPTSDLMNKSLTAIVPNITKNDFKNEFNFESLVHVDTVDSDTLPKLEKMVDKKIDDFSRALNYSLKKFSR